MGFSKLTVYLDTLEEAYRVHGQDCKAIKAHEQVYRYMAGHIDYALSGTAPPVHTP